MTITTDTTLLHDPRRQAALLYWQGFSVPQIAAMLQMKRPTVQSWKQRDGWDSVAPISRVEMSLEARLTQLIIKPQKTGGDFKEIDLLGRQIERLARVNRYSQTGNEADLNPNVANRNKGGRRKPKKNFFSDEAIEKLEQIFFEQSFEYQLHWYRAGLEHRIRDTRSGRVNCLTGDAPAPPNAWKSTSVITPLPVGFSVRTASGGRLSPLRTP